MSEMAVSYGENSYRRSVDKILFVESEIPKEIAGHLQRELGGNSSESAQKLQTTSLEAFHLYLKGRHHWNKRTG